MQPAPPIEPEGTFDGLRPGAIALGVVVDFAATAVASLLLVGWLAPEVFSESEETAREAAQRVNQSTAFLAASVALGALCTTLGAFVGAARAGVLHVRHGGWIAVASAVAGTLLLLVEPVEVASPTPLWVTLLGLALILPAGLAGGALAGALARHR